MGKNKPVHDRYPRNGYKNLLSFVTQVSRTGKELSPIILDKIFLLLLSLLSLQISRKGYHRRARSLSKYIIVTIITTKY